ncbi:MAG: phosphoesterase, partial [Epsilonproteobacteria bacterium]|nr:phosphoesterase [Campylobacterota bacterium]
KVLLGMISNAKEINRVLFPKEDNKYKLFLIEKAKEILDKYTPQEAPIIMDDMLHQFKKEFFIENQINNTKDNLVAFYITNLLNSKKEELIIQYKDYKGILGYNIGSSSIIGNRFLIENPEIDFYMDVNSRGTFSLRSNNRVDVAQIAQEIGNGGGHPNASGGKIDNFKDAFVYSQIKEFIQEYLDQKAKENQNG